MEEATVHHIEYFVRNGEYLLRELTTKYGFLLVSKRFCKCAKQWVVKSKQACFLITQPEIKALFSVLNDSDCKSSTKLTHEADSYVVLNREHLFLAKDLNKLEGNICDAIIDTVCNVSLKVKDVGACVERISKSGGVILQPHTTITDKSGTVDLAIVKSCVGNVRHTLINCDDYHGEFLPYFSDCSTSGSYDGGVTHFDHVTFACNVGSSSHVLKWYEDVLGMKRFLMNSDEDLDDGFVIDTADIGLRLKAMDYWFCAETGLTTPTFTSQGSTPHRSISQRSPIKFVIAEALPNQGPNQVDTFLTEHGGPGIQHIGLHTPDIIKTVSTLKQLNVEFAEPPYTYYTGIGKLKDIQDIGEDVQVLKENGILVDAEADVLDEVENTTDKRYLLQKFTKPLFDRNTFFLEFIHRAGAKGFGSGNITALWRSVQAYLTHKESIKTQTGDGDAAREVTGDGDAAREYTGDGGIDAEDTALQKQNSEDQ